MLWSHVETLHNTTLKADNNETRVIAGPLGFSFLLEVAIVDVVGYQKLALQSPFSAISWNSYPWNEDSLCNVDVQKLSLNHDSSVFSTHFRLGRPSRVSTCSWRSFAVVGTVAAGLEQTRLERVVHEVIMSLTLLQIGLVTRCHQLTGGFWLETSVARLAAVSWAYKFGLQCVRQESALY